MSILADLRTHMTASRELLVGDDVGFGQPDHMAKAAATMKAKLSMVGRSVVSRDRIREALELVNNCGVEEACASHLRFLCWALWEPVGRTAALMGRHDDSVGRILAVVQQDLNQNALSLSTWRGLVAAYFDPEERLASEPQVSNWISVRDFLSKTLSKVVSSARFIPDWLHELADNPELLTNEPCGRYAAAAFRGDARAVNALRENLSIRAESWFWKALILSQIRYTCLLDDVGYLAEIDSMLVLLEDHPALADDALTMILTRHHRSLAEHAHAAVQDYAVRSWGSPNISSQAKWSLVEEPIKQMVREWLVKEDLRDFFSLLQADQAADLRRLKFWLEYAKQIDFAHFVLGAHVWRSPRPDYVEIRRRKHSRIARLVDGSPTNNAFILKLRGYFFVEFGETGNACYMYRADDVPFDVRRLQHSLQDLKHKRRAVEHPSHAGSWEEKFRQQLENFGIFPDRDRRSAPRHAPRPRRAPASAPSPAPVTGWPGQAREIARKHSMEVLDQRPKGGCLWVMTSRENHPAAAALIKLGFRFADTRGYWRKK